jgi:peptidoglycan hydrolase-like protein with peptidoglycan-binding domain
MSNELPVLQKGDKGDYVFALQKRLGIRADGLFDKDTDVAVRLFQRKLGFPVDGVVSRIMWLALGMMAGEASLSADAEVKVADVPRLTDEGGGNLTPAAALQEREPLRWPTPAYLGRLFLFYGLVAVTTGLVALFVITAIARPELALVIVVVAGSLFVLPLFKAAPEQLTPAELMQLMHKLSRRISGLLQHPA